MDLQLKDKRALVLGSSRGTGICSVGQGLAKEGCQASSSTAGTRTRSKPLQASWSGETGIQVIGLAGDVSDFGRAHQAGR